MQDLNGKKILISSCAGLGDLVMFTPALRALKKKYPKCYITFMASDKHKNILAGIPYIDKVICIRRKKFLGRYRVLTDIIKQDIVIFTDWQPQLLIAAWLFRVKRRCGIPKQGHSLNRLFTKILTERVLSYTHFAAKTNAMLFSEALGITLEGDMTHCDVSRPKEIDKKNVDSLLLGIGLTANAEFVLLTPFAGLEQRNWPKAEAKRFVQMVWETRKLPVIVMGPSEASEQASEISNYNLVGKTSTLELVEFIQRAKCLITPDSGPMHIAGALRIPVIPLFSKDLPSRWAPKENCYPVTLQKACSPCDDDTAQNCPTVACMREITAEMVIHSMNLAGC